tara:strand:- start:121 stop:291 length:171 start_codon:yes stop_codon:yes gene_type:complete
MNESKITRSELAEIFGDMLPMEVVSIIFEAPDTDTIADVRLKVMAFAASAAPTEDK